MKEYHGDQRTVKHILEDKAATLGDRDFIQFKDVKLSYRSINQIANRVGNGLLSLGVRKGDHILVMLPNGLEILYSWFGAAKIGAVEVPVNINFKGDTLLHVINDSRAKYLIIDRQYLDRLDFIKEGITCLRTLIICGAGGELPEVGFNAVRFDDLLKGSPDTPEVEVKADDPATIMYTSGTTGPSKGVIQPQAYAYAYGKVAAVPGAGGVAGAFVEEDDIYYSYLPLYHTAAKYVDVIGTILAGARIVLAERFSSGNLLERGQQLRGHGHLQPVRCRFPVPHASQTR